MSDKLAILEKRLPLRAYPKEKLEEVFENVFIDWISNLLGLTGEDAAKRLLIAIPAIEKHFWSLGFDEIKKAFTMYADSELITKPIPNYFTRILVGKIFKEYNQQKPIAKIMIPESITPTKEEKDELFITTLKDEFKIYKETGVVNYMRNWLYDDLIEKGIVIEDIMKSIAWKHSIKEVTESEKHLQVRDRSKGDALKSKAIVVYKTKLLEIIFKRFISFEQLSNILV